MIDFKGNLDDHLPLMQFSYSNSFTGKDADLILDGLKRVNWVDRITYSSSRYGESGGHSGKVENNAKLS